jgi:hypothetical protein
MALNPSLYSVAIDYVTSTTTITFSDISGFSVDDQILIKFTVMEKVYTHDYGTTATSIITLSDSTYATGTTGIVVLDDGEPLTYLTKTDKARKINKNCIENIKKFI